MISVPIPTVILMITDQKYNRGSESANRGRKATNTTYKILVVGGFSVVIRALSRYAGGDLKHIYGWINHQVQNTFERLKSKPNWTISHSPVLYMYIYSSVYMPFATIATPLYCGKKRLRIPLFIMASKKVWTGSIICESTFSQIKFEEK